MKGNPDFGRQMMNRKAELSADFDSKQPPEEFINLKFSLYTGEKKRLEALGGMLHTHIEAALKLAISPRRRNMGIATTIYCDGQPISLVARIHKELWERFMRKSFSNDGIGEAISDYLNCKAVIR